MPGPHPPHVVEKVLAVNYVLMVLTELWSRLPLPPEASARDYCWAVVASLGVAAGWLLVGVVALTAFAWAFVHTVVWWLERREKRDHQNKEVRHVSTDNDPPPL